MTALLAVLLALPAAAAAPVFKADARLELLGAVELAAGGRAKRFVDPKDEYSSAARALMAPFKEHPAVKLQAAFPKTFDYIARCDIADRLSPGLEATTTYFLPDPTLALAGGRERVEPWIAALRDLSEASRFDEFFAGRRAALEARAAPFRKAAEDVRLLAAIEEYAGRPFDGTYEITVSPYFDAEKMLNSVWPRPDGSRELRTAVSAGAGRGNPAYFFQERFPSALWHQLAHGFWDSRVEAAKRSLVARGDGRKEACFGEWEQCVKENVVRAVTARLLAKNVSEKAAKRFLKDGDEDMYPRMPALLKSLEAYEAKRADYPTLDSYLPVLFEAFPVKETAAK